MLSFHIVCLCVFVFVMEIWNRLVTEIVILYKGIRDGVGIGTNVVPVQLSILDDHNPVAWLSIATSALARLPPAYCPSLDIWVSNTKCQSQSQICHLCQRFIACHWSSCGKPGLFRLPCWNSCYEPGPSHRYRPHGYSFLLQHPGLNQLPHSHHNSYRWSGPSIWFSLQFYTVSQKKGSDQTFGNNFLKS